MKPIWLAGFVLVGILLFVLSGCTPEGTLAHPWAELPPQPSNPQPVASVPIEQSNQKFLEGAIDQLNIGAVVKGHIPSGETVALVSMEETATLDLPLEAMLEDRLIHSLLENGIRVYERDQEVVGRMVQEKSASTFKMSVLPWTAGSPLTSDAEQQNSWAALQPTQLSSADYLVSYRILEIGITSAAGDLPYKTRRSSLVELHIRIQNTSTGEVLFADNLTGKNEDQISTVIWGQLKDFHWTFFPYTYPLQEETPVKIDVRK